MSNTTTTNNNNNLKGKTIFITGGSRGIGRAMALRFARDAANIVLAAKTSKPHPVLAGTIHSVAKEVRDAGGNALAIQLDVRDAVAIKSCVQQAADHFGGIDALINNAGAICLTPLANTSQKQIDLMLDINLRAPMLCVQACLPWLKQADNPHIINMAPKPELRSEWFAKHSPYTISKFANGMLVTGLAAELADTGIAVNALWPRCVIATDALRMLDKQFNIDHKNCRQPAIVADAAHALLCRNARSCSGQFLSDETLLRSIGVQDFTPYALSADAPLMRDLFID